PEIVDLEYKARSGDRADQLELLKLVQGLLVQYGPIDELWLWSPYRPQSLLNRLKTGLSNGDPQECNDSFEMAWPIYAGAEALQANLAPEGLDVDFFSMGLEPPPLPEGVEPPKTPPRPIGVKIVVSRPPGPSLPLKVTFTDRQRKPLLTETV